MMNHKYAMSERDTNPDKRDIAPGCQGDLLCDGGGFWDDVSWTVYKCQGCGQRIATVGGGRHWWNYVISESSFTRLTQ
jgi:hypothetical protein